MARVFLLVMDSVGVGGAPDAAAYGDAGADTLGHIAERCAAGAADAGRAGPLRLPNLDRLGLGAACALATGRTPPGLGAEPEGLWGIGIETSNGKDTPSGHWEIAGAPVDFDWGYFPHEVPAMPDALTQALIARADLPGVLANRHASGTQVIEAYGAAHLQSGKPIIYTSTDSVLQIAAHEEAFGLERLYRLCEIAREEVDALKIGRVIARPFLGDAPDNFKRTPKRRDYATPPHKPTICDQVSKAGGQVIAIGKIGDIFAHRGIAETRKGACDADLFQLTLDAIASAPQGALVFANYVEFDSEYGHRRDVAGYARALEAFDPWAARFAAALRADDLMLLTADHGNDPTWTGTDHTRECVPILGVGPARAAQALGRRGFSDIGASALAHLGLPPLAHGESFL